MSTLPAAFVDVRLKSLIYISARENLPDIISDQIKNRSFIT